MNKRTSQPVQVERDRGGGYSFELDHVYAPGNASDPRGTIRALDPPACFWQVTESKTGLSRTLSFAAAKEGRGTLTFRRFSSLNDVRDELLALFA